MAERVIDYGEFVVVEDSYMDNGLFGCREIVNRKRYTKDEWARMEVNRANGEFARMAVAGLVSLGFLAWEGFNNKKKDTGFFSFKLPWKK